MRLRCQINVVQKAFELANEGTGTTKVGPEDPSVDIQPQGDEMVLTLTLNLGGIWKPKYVFKLLPVELRKVNLLEAQLRDAQEEIILHYS